MRNKLIWPAVAIICASIIASGIYLGLRDSQPQPTTQTYGEHQLIDLGPAQTLLNEAAKENDYDPIVYVTRTGECYHRGSCGYLRRSKIPMKLSEARKRYRACSRCGPPR